MNEGPLGFFSFLFPPLLVLELKGWLDDCLIGETPPLRDKPEYWSGSYRVPDLKEERLKPSWSFRSFCPCVLGLLSLARYIIRVALWERPGKC